MANTREETAQNGQSTGAVTPVPIYGLIPVHDLDEKAVKHLTAEEIPLRCKMATLCRIMDMNGWTNSLHNTVTVCHDKNLNLILGQSPPIKRFATV